MKLVIAMAVSIAAFASPAGAGCSFGNNSLGGSIGPGQTDKTRSYSLDGKAVLSVAGAQDAGGSPGDLEVTFPGNCRTRVGSTVSCTVNDYGSVSVVIRNLGRRQITYNWVCSSL